MMRKNPGVLKDIEARSDRVFITANNQLLDKNADGTTMVNTDKEGNIIGSTILLDAVDPSAPVLLHELKHSDQQYGQTLEAYNKTINPAERNKLSLQQYAMLPEEYEAEMFAAKQHFRKIVPDNYVDELAQLFMDYKVGKISKSQYDRTIERIQQKTREEVNVRQTAGMQHFNG